MFGNCPNPGGIYVNSALGGCPPTHPNSQRPNCAPPQQVSCESCQGGYPVVNMFPGTSCPSGWIPSGSGTTATGLPNLNPCNVLGQPGINNTFTTNIHNGYTQFGCSFLYNRHGVLSQKLAQLQSAGTNPLWQQMLQTELLTLME